MDLYNFSGLNNEPNVIAFSAMIAWAEGTDPHPLTVCKGYDVIVTGVDRKPEITTSFTDHPFMNRPAKKITNGGLYSTASGRYQILKRYWTHYKKQLGLSSFDNVNQDKYFTNILKEQKAYNLVISGDIKGAIQRVSNIWASMPSAGYGQPERKMDGLLYTYDKAKEEEILRQFKAEEIDVSSNHCNLECKNINEILEAFNSNLAKVIEIIKNK